MPHGVPVEASEPVTTEADDALIVVDLQNDFLPGGSLPVAEGNRVFVPINALMPRFQHVYATRDWHPRHHASFQAQGGPWPFHCLQGTPGAEFSPLLDRTEIDEVISKGVDPQTDGYSAFAGTDLAERLRRHGVRRLFVCGLATDYCVKATALEGLGHGFEVLVVTDAIAAVKVKPEDEAAALEEMRRAGVRFVTSDRIRSSSPLTRSP
ncbi:MAG TPA: nicotinamidase [Candidatus Dormibacteraeota bacterium]|nr:nicotinamidase [Candidatus Dormibacteraeota bacterium]